MSKTEGLKEKFAVNRLDGKKVGACIVLEFQDPVSWPALLMWASTVEKSGYTLLAKEIREKVARLSEARPAVDDTDVVDKPQIKATINKHGDERNRRLETQQAQFSSHEFTVLERYCEDCKAWKETKGLVSTNFCPSCNMPYNKEWLQD